MSPTMIPTFIFDEMLGNCVLAFSRDAWVPKNSVVKTHSTLPL